MKNYHELRYGGEIVCFSASLAFLVNLRKNLLASSVYRYPSMLEIFKDGKELYND